MTRQEALETLGLSGNPTPDEINRAYSECAKKYHPDLYATQSDPVREVMNEKMRRVNMAREVLHGTRQVEGQFTQSEDEPGPSHPRPRGGPDSRCAICGAGLSDGFRCAPCQSIEQHLAECERQRNDLLARRESRLREAGLIGGLWDELRGKARHLANPILLSPGGVEAEALQRVADKASPAEREYQQRRDQYASTVLSEGGAWFHCPKCTAPQIRVTYTTKNRRQLQCNLCSWMERFTLDESEMVRRSF